MTAYTVSILLNIFGAGLTFLILMLLVVSLNVKDRIQLWFFLNVVCLLVNFLASAAVLMLIGHSGYMISIGIRIFDCICYCTAGFEIFAFAWYLYEYLGSKTTVNKKVFVMMSFFGIAIIPFSIIAFTRDIYFRLDESNNYIRQPTFWVSEISLITSMILFLWIIVHYAKILKTREWVTLVLYVLVPLMCNGLEVFIPDLYIALFGASCTVALIYVNIQVDLKHQMQLKELELKENRIAIMLSQIQPHFLYNSLASIEYLCIVEGSEQSAAAVRDFSKYLRGNMDSITYKGLIPFEKELQHVDLYLSLEKRRFGDLIQTKYDTPVTAFDLPPLTLQPIVENAVRHGITRKEEGGLITIRTEEDEAFWRIAVTDDGVGFAAGTREEDCRSHIGIANVRSRLETLCGGQLMIESIPGVGTTVTMLIPKTGGRGL